ncbi:STM4504/CBY_0614 family protein [Aestuariibius sp. 2305UL40-4]|uniref:STM4504/CBY_0614 family protein n=1 Tax=Aestuariibius violaceus TaxID=3234132 RepID=UPI00345E5B15
MFDLFSKRVRAENVQDNDVYIYDLIPEKLRVQIVHILDDGLGDDRDYRDHYTPGDTEGIYKAIAKLLRREYGVFRLSGRLNDKEDFRAEVLTFFMSEGDFLRVLDVIEICFRMIEKVTNEWSGKFKGRAALLVSELNQRMRENNVGYQYVSGAIVKLDTEFTHKEIIKPSLNFLSGQRFLTARDEFISAHQKYRSGEHRECLVDCVRSLESTLKIILSSRGVSDTETMSSSQLVKTAFEKNIVPKYLESQFTSLRTLLMSGSPTIRNKIGAHGQGEKPISVPESISSYALNLTGSTILFLSKLK